MNSKNSNIPRFRSSNINKEVQTMPNSILKESPFPPPRRPRSTSLSDYATRQDLPPIPDSDDDAFASDKSSNSSMSLYYSPLTLSDNEGGKASFTSTKKVSFQESRGPIKKTRSLSHLPYVVGDAFVHKNWKLLSLWDSKLANIDKMCDKKIFQDKINECVVGRIRDDSFSLLDEKFTVVRITNPFPMSKDERVVLIGEGISYMYCQRSIEEFYNRSKICIVASAELAQILAATINKSDLLVVFGGFNFSWEGELLLELNARNMCTYIIRISNSSLMEEEICLAEKIEPMKKIDNRFKFTCTVKRGRTYRDVIKHRDFSFGFCQDITKTLAFSRKKCGLCMPIVRDSNPYEIYELLLSEDFEIADLDSSLSPSSSATPRSERENDSDSTLDLETDDEKSLIQEPLIDEGAYATNKTRGTPSRIKITPRATHHSGTNWLLWISVWLFTISLIIFLAASIGVIWINMRGLENEGDANIDTTNEPVPMVSPELEGGGLITDIPYAEIPSWKQQNWKLFKTWVSHFRELFRKK